MTLKRGSLWTILASGVVALTLVAPEYRVFAREQGAQPPTLPLPLHLSAWAVSMSNVATGRNNVIDIRITRWTTPQEREGLFAALLEKGPDGLMKALTKLPESGRLRVPGLRGPDPQKLVLGWGLHYTWNVPDGDGGQRIVIATDRYVTFEEARNQPRVSDYPITLIDIRLDKKGEGTGKASVATKISFDKKKNIMEIENYSSEPVRLQNVKLEKG